MTNYSEIEKQFAGARPPRAGSTSWYDACDQFATQVKTRLRERFGRCFLVEAYGDEVGLILRVRGDGYGAKPWSVDRGVDFGRPLAAQIESAIDEVAVCVRENYVIESAGPV
ncbi:MAG: hypothetical protein ACI841_000413 [Planctomycetota bacterium]|jgi:hypothetical protein